MTTRGWWHLRDGFWPELVCPALPLGAFPHRSQLIPCTALAWLQPQAQGTGFGVPALSWRRAPSAQNHSREGARALRGRASPLPVAGLGTSGWAGPRVSGWSPA